MFILFGLFSLSLFKMKNQARTPLTRLDFSTFLPMALERAGGVQKDAKEITSLKIRGFARSSGCVNVNFSVDSSGVGSIYASCTLDPLCSVGVSGIEILLVILLILFRFATLSQCQNNGDEGIKTPDNVLC